MSTKEPVSFTKKYEVYNDAFELVSKEVNVNFVEVDNEASALEAINKSGSLIDAANYLIRRNALAEARKNAGVSGGINRAVLMEFIKPYRENPEFASMIKTADKRKATAEEWNAQTEAILAQLKNIPFVVKSIKDRSALAGEDE